MGEVRRPQPPPLVGSVRGDGSFGLHERCTEDDHRGARKSIGLSGSASMCSLASFSPNRGGNRVDVVAPEEVGIAFGMRARIANTTSRNSQSWLLTSFDRPHASESVPSRQARACSRYARCVAAFVTGTRVVQRIERFLKGSMLVSCVYVLAVVSVEPACRHQKESSFTATVTTLHVVNSVVYALLALPGRLLVGRANLAAGEDVVKYRDGCCSLLRSPGFWCDVVALVGLVAELMYLVQDPGGVAASAAQWIMLLQLGKAWRLILPGSVSRSWRDSGFLQGVAWLFLSLAFFAHVMASLLLALGNQEAEWGDSSWVDELRGQSCEVLYTEALYFAVLSLTSVGYGDLLTTPSERAVNSLLLLLAQLFTAKVCADLTWLTSTHNHWEAELQERQAQAWIALGHMKVPRMLAKRVLAFQNYVSTVHREDLTQPAFAGLSANLMTELRLCSYRNLVLKAPFLREQPKNVIEFIVGTLIDTIYMPEDLIVRVGDVGRELFFVRRGEAAVFVGPEMPCWGEDREVAAYITGAYFGELGMLTGRPRSAWIMAKVFSVCSILPYSAMETLSSTYPGSFTTLVQSMVLVYKLKSGLSWEDVSQRMVSRYGFSTIEEAFAWFCDQGGHWDDDELTAMAFNEAMRRMKVAEVDSRILWAEMDTNNSGFVTLSEFDAKLHVDISESDHNAGRASEGGTSPKSPKQHLTEVEHTFSAQSSTPCRRDMSGGHARLSHHNHKFAETRVMQDLLDEVRREMREDRETMQFLAGEISRLASAVQP